MDGQRDERRLPKVLRRDVQGQVNVIPFGNKGQGMQGCFALVCFQSLFDIPRQ